MSISDSLIKKSKYVAEYSAYLLLRAFLRSLPFGLMIKKADGIGNWIFRTFKIRQDIIQANLRYAFGDSYNGQPIEDLLYRLYGHLFKTVLELANIHRIIHQIDRYIQFEHLEILRDALREKKGVLLATGHFGNFELGALALAWVGMPISLLIKPVRNPFLDRELMRLRQSFGAEVNLVDDAGRRILSTLRKNRIICMLSDQDFGLKRGTIVQFFGHPTSTPTGTARMALHTRAPIIPVYFYREDTGMHVLKVEPPLEVNYSKDMKEKEILRITQQISWDLEKWISLHPEQYFWLHRRWKSTPDGKWLYPKRK
jgi:KDO2-lipid IV(A) lauroyltransferase